MKTWYLYILLCNQKIFYTGITNNLENRLIVHKEKKSLFTKKFSDIELVYTAKFDNKYEAAAREKQIKGWSNAKKNLLIQDKLGLR